jgi:hypothetical protein
MSVPAAHGLLPNIGLAETFALLVLSATQAALMQQIGQLLTTFVAGGQAAVSSAVETLHAALDDDAAAPEFAAIQAGTCGGATEMQVRRCHSGTAICLHNSQNALRMNAFNGVIVLGWCC